MCLGTFSSSFPSKILYYVAIGVCPWIPHIFTFSTLPKDAPFMLKLREKMGTMDGRKMELVVC